MDKQGGSAFITQRGEKNVRSEINELEQLLAAAGQTSQSTLLLKKRKEMREVDESLEVMKRDHKKRMDECEERRLQFEIKQARMREQVIRFERFIHENDAKRQRAEAKARQERKAFEEKVKEIAALQERIRVLEEEQKLLAHELVKKSCYKTYLEKIVEEGEYGYEEINEILNRHATLKQANIDLLEHSNKLDQAVDELRKSLQSVRTEKQNQLLVSTSILQDLQGELERKRSNVKSQEEGNLQRENKKKDVSREFTQTIQAIKNLFGRCNSTMRVKQVFANQKDNVALIDTLENELDVIMTRMVDLIEICKEYNQEQIQPSSHTNSLPIASGSIELKEASISSGASNQLGISAVKSIVSSIRDK